MTDQEKKAPVLRKAPDSNNTVRMAEKQLRKKNRRMNNRLVICLLAASAVTIVALLINVVRIVRADSGTASSSTTVNSDTQNTMSNNLYTIGNNPTDLEKQYFQELTDAISAGDDKTIAEKVAINFTADYFTWRNKDGNYEVGGLQYVLGSGYLSLNDWTRWNYGSNFDLYLSQYGQQHLPQVSAVNVVSCDQIDDFTVKLEDPQRTLPCYLVKADIQYEPDTVLDTSGFPWTVTYFIVNNNGRMEIVEIYAWGEGYEAEAEA